MRGRGDSGPAGAPAPAPQASGPGPEDTGISAYLDEVRRAMFGLSSNAKAGILEELREHLSDLTVEAGGAEAALRQMEEPKKLARGFREVYGYGPGFSAMLGAAAVFLSLLSIPSLGGISVLALLLLYVHLVLTSLYGGKTLGWLSGAAACVFRVAAVGALWYFSPGAYAVPDQAELLLFAIGSVLLPVAGFMAGETKERYKRGRPVEF